MTIILNKFWHNLIAHPFNNFFLIININSATPKVPSTNFKTYYVKLHVILIVYRVKLVFRSHIKNYLLHYLMYSNDCTSNNDFYL